jgi:anti-anti-sigma regulatory factor/CHASE3 domain sensor protein
VSVKGLRDSSDAVARSETRLFNASRAQRLSVDLETGMRGYFLSGDDAFAQPAETAENQLPGVIAELRRVSAGDPVQRARAARIEALARSFTAFTAREISMGARRPRAELVAASAEGKRRLDALRTQYETYIASEQAEAQRRNDEASGQASRARIVGVIGFLLLLAAIPLSLLYLMRVVVAPVRGVADAAERLASGDPGARAQEAGAGEVGQLARSFNAMADALEVSRGELEQRGIRLGETNRQLRDAFADLERSKQQAILELSTPVLQLSAGVLVLPIIGALDVERAQQIDDRLLAEVRARRARVVVIDVTGVPEIDSLVAAQLLGTVTAVRLLGARAITTGVSGELAAALVALEVDFTVVESYADLQRGVESATGRVARS